MAGLMGLIGGEAGYPRSSEEPAKKEEESSLMDFAATDRLLRVNVVRRGASSVCRSDLRASRGPGELGDNSTVDFEAQDRRKTDAPDVDTAKRK